MKINSDAIRRGLRTLIDVLLSGASSGLILVLLNAVGVHTTPSQFAALLATLTPVLSVIKNSLEDKTGKSFLVDKTRPEPDPVTQTALPVVEGENTTATNTSLSHPMDAGPLPAPTSFGPIMNSPVPPGYLLVAMAPEDIDSADEVVGYIH